MAGPAHTTVTTAELARLLIALEDDERLPVAARRERDAALRPVLGAAAHDAARLRAWLEHVDADGRRLAGEVAAVLRGAGTLALAIGALTGWLTVLGAFYYDGGGRVNVLAVLGALVVLPLLLLAGSWLGLAAGQAGSAPLDTLATALRRAGAGRLAALAARIYTGDGRRGLRVLLAHRDARVVVVRHLLLARWAHVAACGFFAAALATALALIVFTDLAFGWSTTLDLTPPTVHALVQVMAAPWQPLWPGAVPDLALVEGSRYFRLADPRTTVLPIDQLGRWWSFLIAAIALYGLVPRLASLWLVNRLLGAALGRALTGCAGACAVLERLREPQVDGHALTPALQPDRLPATPGPEHDEHAAGAGGEGVAARAQAPQRTGGEAAQAGPVNLDRAPGGVVINWSGVPLGDDVLCRLLGALRAHHAGSGMDLEAEEALVAQLDVGGAVTVVCKAWEPPLLDLMDFLDALAARRPARLLVLPVRCLDGQAVAPSPRDDEVWSRALAGAPAQRAVLPQTPEAGVERAAAAAEERP